MCFIGESVALATFVVYANIYLRCAVDVLLFAGGIGWIVVTAWKNVAPMHFERVFKAS